MNSPENSPAVPAGQIDPLAMSVSEVLETGTRIDNLPGPAETTPMQSTSVRLPLDLVEWARTEAARRQLLGWGELVRQLLEAERMATEATGAEVVSVADLQRAIRTLARQAHPSSGPPRTGEGQNRSPAA